MKEVVGRLYLVESKIQIQKMQVIVNEIAAVATLFRNDKIRK
jgi:hypothetical protein